MSFSKRTTHKTHINFPVGIRVRNADLSGLGTIMSSEYMDNGQWKYSVLSYNGSIEDAGILMVYPKDEQVKLK